MDPKTDYRRLVEAKLNLARCSRQRPPAARGPPSDARASAARRSPGSRSRRCRGARGALLGRLLVRSARCSAPSARSRRPGAHRRNRSACAPVWQREHRRSPVPLTVGGERRSGHGCRRARDVVRVEAATGRELWRAVSAPRISAGVGSDGTLAAVVTRTGELVALEGGRVNGSSVLGVRVAPRPWSPATRIFVIGVDRSVHGLGCADGRKLWVLQRPGDPLYAVVDRRGRHTFKDTLLVGQGPRIAGVDPKTASCAGRFRSVPTRYERGRAARRSHRSRDPRRRPRLRARVPSGCRLRRRPTRHARCGRKNVGGTNAIGGDGEMVFGADATDRITGLAHSRQARWLGVPERFLYRGLAAPHGDGDAASTFGDIEGQGPLLLDRTSGEPLAARWPPTASWRWGGRRPVLVLPAALWCSRARAPDFMLEAVRSWRY